MARALAGVKIPPPIPDKPRDEGDAIPVHPGLAALAMRTGHLQGFRVWAIGRRATGGRGWLSRRELGKVLRDYGISTEMGRRGLQNGGAAFFGRSKGRVWLASPENAYVALWDGKGLPTLGNYTVTVEAGVWRSLPKLKRALFVGSLANEATISQQTAAEHWGVSLAQITRWTYRRRDVERRTNFEVATGTAPEHWEGRNYWEPRPGLYVRRLPNTYQAPGLEVRAQGSRLRKQNKAIRGAVVGSARIFGTGERLPGLQDRVFFPSVATAVRYKRRRGLSPGAVIADVDKALAALARTVIFSPTAQLWAAA